MLAMRRRRNWVLSGRRATLVLKLVEPESEPGKVLVGNLGRDPGTDQGLEHDGRSVPDQHQESDRRRYAIDHPGTRSTCAKPVRGRQWRHLHMHAERRSGVVLS